MRNPFTLGLIEEEEKFCNRHQERKELLQYAKNGHNVVIYSPRRYGKSSLVNILQKDLSKDKFLTAYIDLFPIASAKAATQRIVSGLLKGFGRGIDPRSFLEKMKDVFLRVRPVMSVEPEGVQFSAQLESDADPLVLLEDCLEGVGKWIKKVKKRAFVVFDEFQEITQLPEAKAMEGVIRSKIQSHHDIAYFFVGSRRSVLKDIFTAKNRPFYKSAFLYSLGKISEKEFVDFLMVHFKNSGKTCSKEICQKIYDLVQGYPYYVQKLSSLVWDGSDKKPSFDILDKTYRILLQSETPDFEAHWSGLTNVQKQLLQTLAKQPTSSLFSKNHLKQHGLSIGGVQKALKALLEKDLIEKAKEKYILTDPIMAKWLNLS